MRSKQQPRPSYRWLNSNDNEESTSPDSGTKDQRERGRGAARGEGESSPLASPASHASPPPDDIEHSIPATLIQDPNAERESPRCLSRESSGAPRCPSNDSVYSGRSAPSLPLPAALSAALPAALPAALLPPHSAAVAAYLGAAAAAAQQRLLMSCQEDLADAERSDAVLDFSTKRSESPPDDDDIDADDAVNLSKNENCPLDLSVGTRKRGPENSPSPVPTRKSSRSADFKPLTTPWTTPVAPHLPYFAAAVAAASLSPKGSLSNDWNGKLKHGAPTPSDATKALEKMSELSRLGGEELFRSVQSAALGAGLTPNAAARHSAWQSHWLNKGADQTKDVLKCVWCKKSFNSLADLTVHMKEAKHCGVNVPMPPTSGAQMPPSLHPPSSSPSTPSHNSSSSTSSSKPNHNDLNMLIKENMPIPRKLVRGQDVWLGKGAEQTRQILKCMWCAESFRSLAEMTSHMQRTQHYTNIISQEQIISWKSSDEAKGSNSSTPGTNNTVPPTTGTSSHVSAVLTCKVCDQAFSSLKELSNHMVKNSHYKEHIMRSITESGGRRRQTREKRKKSLPVRKLLELERAQHEFKNGEGNGVPMGKPIRDFGTGSRITCEKCGDKIETALFVEHIRQCIGAPMSNSQRNFLKSALLSNNIIPPDVPGHVTPTNRDGRKSINDEIPSPGSGHHRSPSSMNDSSPSSKDPNASNDKSSSPSVLNAIEQLIEKSFDTRSRHSVPGMPGGTSHAPIGSSILKRLGIDESVDYTKPLVDQQTMNMLRNYHHQQGYGRRERSGSESSSMSERGGSRVESLTPDRKLDSYHMTPRTTPDTRGSQTPASEADRQSEVRIKKEVTDEDECENGVDLSNQPVRVKTEVDDDEEQARPNSSVDEDVKPPLPKRESEGPSPVPSPRSPSSDRSAPTPGSDRKPASSLGALSSMFDNLAGGGSSTEPSSSRRSGSHPLAALQKLCDKTENNSTRAPPPAPSPAGPPSILTFSWACNDAVVTDSIMKCALCDTPFISKGAYRHHLSKMHFVKDGALPDPVPMKAPPPAASPGTHKSGGSNAASPQDPRSPSQSFDESPHSKFLKYTELAKQLSSKYV
ncbi:protein tiptop-like isoform X1 [Pieris brassicae]|uniref:protein tiptop-like isoform X1 n=1 Tax=Pieris brassicae TaxID=7116 RepID=UPI001E660A94|nr:protein tiptop-like isoform X1 [Pieris brassicae]XP_045532769.1 protein tiptop-like isoform X1 [Pieris brassicae]